MDPTIPYTACVLGAAALYMLLRPGRAAFKVAGVIIGVGVFIGLLLGVGAHLSGGRAARPEFFFTIFSLVTVACGVRMITHSKPVYSALYFILVVLSVASLFLLLEAEFIAFALIIVYAGAILVTYVFVLMLAQQSPTPENAAGQPEYDLVPREPAAAVVVAFILMALLTNMVFDGTASMPAPPDAMQVRAKGWHRLDAMPRQLDQVVQAEHPGATIRPADDGSRITVRDGDGFVDLHPEGGGTYQTVRLPDEALPDNIQRVGLDLILEFPVSLELAGIILLMAMLGAVVLARRQIELGEDELREAAGIQRLDFSDSGDASPGGDA